MAPVTRSLFSAAVFGLGAIAFLLTAVDHKNIVPYSGLSIALLSIAFLFSMSAIGWISSGSRIALSMQVMLLYFSVYLILPGMVHVATGQYPFSSIEYERWVTDRSSLILIIFIFVSLFSYALCGLRSDSSRPSLVVGSLTVQPRTWFQVCMVALSLFAMIVYVMTLGVGQLFSLRGDIRIAPLVGASGTGLFVNLPRVFTVVVFVYCFSVVRYSNRSFISMLLLLLSAIPIIVTMWPLSVPRSSFFGFMLFLSAVAFSFHGHASRVLLSGLYIVGAFVAMPVLDGLTRARSGIGSIDLSSLYAKYFQSGDFDGLQSINNAVVYVGEHGVANGIQLLSAVLFFVPRSLWLGKAQPTGTVAADFAGYGFTNVSMPLPSEFYFDFGFLGVIIGGAAVGCVLFKLDGYFTAKWAGSVKARMLAGAVIGYTIAIYRGTLIGVVPPISLLVLILLIIMRFGFIVDRVELSRS